MFLDADLDFPSRYAVIFHLESWNTIYWLKPIKILLFPKSFTILKLGRGHHSSNMQLQFPVAGYSFTSPNRGASYPFSSHDRAVTLKLEK